MKIIIVGCGRVGINLAEKLSQDGNEITVIDVDGAKVRAIAEKCDVMGVVGNGATHSVQEEAGIEETDLFIAVTNSDELNLLCCIVAKRAGKCQTIARVKNPDYSTESAYIKDELGLAMVINPEYAAAEEIARVLRFPSAIKIEPFTKGMVELMKFKLSKDSLIVGMSVKDVMIKYHTDLLVCTVERGDEVFIAGGDFVFEEKDVVSIVATPKAAKEFLVKIRHAGHSISNAVIVGGSVITQYLCGIMERTGMNLKIIEKDYKTCEELASQWEKVDVIHGNPTNKDLLLEEGVGKAGAFVALSNLDEENILLSLFAKEEGCEKLITKINRTDYDAVVSRLDLDTTICPINITSDLILRYVRATKNSMGSNMETLYNVIPGKVEASEFIIKENSPIADTPLYQLKLKKDVLVASIKRDKQVIIPRGNDVIKAGDAVVIVTKNIGLSDITEFLA